MVWNAGWTMEIDAPLRRVWTPRDPIMETEHFNLLLYQDIKPVENPLVVKAQKSSQFYKNLEQRKTHFGHYIIRLMMI